MNFHVYIEDALERGLLGYCNATGKKRNAVMRSALAQYLREAGYVGDDMKKNAKSFRRSALPLPQKPFASQKEWQEFLRNFHHDPDFPSVEELRAGLLPPREDIF